MKKSLKALLGMESGDFKGDSIRYESFLSIATRLEEAISSPLKADLAQLSDELTEVFRLLMKVAPADAIAAVRASSKASDESLVAYFLGQLSFAQLVASSATEKRADDIFHQVIKDKKFAMYIAALYKNHVTCGNLAESVGSWPETASRKLKELRAVGVTDYRREGVNIINFLTPAAVYVIEKLLQDSVGLDSLAKLPLIQAIEDYQEKTPEISVEIGLEKLMGSLDPIMRKQQNFAHEIELEAA